jgi:phage terminase large subunit
LNLEIPTAEVFLPLLENEDARYLAAHGGRASAKSHFFAEKLVERCLMVPRTRALCVREHQVSLKNSVKQLVVDKIAHFKAGKYFEVLTSEIRTPGDGLIAFQGMKGHTADSVKSFEDFDLAWVEEAQRMSQKSLTLLRPTIRKPRSQMWFSWNPLSPKDPVDDFFRGAPNPDAAVVQSNYMDNPWISKEVLAEANYDKRRNPEQYGHVWLGQYLTKSKARVFSNWRIGEPHEFPSMVGRKRMYGADWGFATDPTVLIEVTVEGRTLYVTRELYRVGIEIDHTPAFFDQMDGAKKWPITADSARPETISYMKRHGYPTIRPSIKGANSVEEGVEFLKSFDIVVHPDCIHTIDELTLYSYKVDPLTEEVLPILADDKNHVIDAVRYAIERERRAKAGVF